jgi:3-hydroxyisobutyrate dehydrogenase-like beta-hydroxyacid dehydrogenase
VTTIGFVGLGVMGGPMCRNMAAKHAGHVLAFDLSVEARQAPADSNTQTVSRIDELFAESDIVFLSLPGGPQVESVRQGRPRSAERGRGFCRCPGRSNARGGSETHFWT